MDTLIKATFRVQRNIDSVETLLNLITKHQPQTNITSTLPSDADRRRILDFPAQETEEANFTSTTNLSKPALLTRTITNPSLLTDPEVDLIKNRFWTKVSRAERLNHDNALMELVGISEEYWMDTVAELEAIRKPFYAMVEEKAIRFAGEEQMRRVVLFANTGVPYQVGVPHPGEADFPGDRPRPDAKDWVKTLWEESQGKEMWGYAGFVYWRLESDEYLARKGAALQWARGAVGLGDQLEARFGVRTLEWPPAAAEVSWTEMLKRLREKFRALRALPPRQRDVTGKLPVDGGLEAGVLRNVFLLEDEACLDQAMDGRGAVDDMWVWAIDPDHEPNEDEEDGEDGSEKYEMNDVYRGYMRVRLQQLVNNFYEACKFHADEYPMRRLWEVAKDSRNCAFVSVHPQEARLWSGARDVGSALRPPPASSSSV